uniref:Uncharacterized protein n=1 Tax=Sphaerodactylus townsendi TaxID=933632 RepID=A0ACB8EG79_9SAUR
MRKSPPKDVTVAQKCSYSRFENGAPILEDRKKRANDLNSVLSSPRQVQESESHRSGTTSTTCSHHLEPDARGHSEGVGHPPEDSSFSKMDLQTLAAPKRTKSPDAPAAVTNLSSSNSEPCMDHLSWKQKCCSLARSPKQMMPTWTVAGGPYEAKRISHMYLHRNTRPW